MRYMQKLALIAAMAMCSNPFDNTGNRTPEIHPKKQLTNEERERIKKQYNNQFHKFIICGTEIIAKSKKDAKKIYSKMKNQRFK